MPKTYHSSLSPVPTSERQAVTFRLDPAVYGALAERCTTHQISMNSLVNQALASYLSVPVPQDPHLSYQDAIRKLSGGPDSGASG